jgi:hypothetical protein
MLQVQCYLSMQLDEIQSVETGGHIALQMEIYRALLRWME